jgi:hypothetical protein
MEAEYTFDFTEQDPNAIDIFDEFMAEHVQEVSQNPMVKDSLWWMGAYKITMINMVRYILYDITDILTERGIKDIETQRHLTEHFNNHINDHITEIVEPLLPLFGEYTVTEGVIKVNFNTDFNTVLEHLASASAIALDRSIYEVGQIVEQQMEKDCASLTEISGMIKTCNEEDLAKYCAKNNPQLLEKYGPIAFLSKEFGFNPAAFRETIKYFASNLSEPYSQILLKYYELSVPRGRHYKKLMAKVQKAITYWVNSLKTMADNEESIRKLSDKGKQDLYRSWVATEPRIPVDRTPAESN